MSNFGQGITAVVGGIVGFMVGGPTGAAYGFQGGLLAGSAIFPTQLPSVVGPRMEDMATTTAQVGTPVIETWGTIAVPGTVMWLGPLREETQTEEVGGKGSPPEQSVTTYTYFQSIAVGLCEGPISGVLRIWENGKLVYDMREQQDGEDDDAYGERTEASYQYALGFTLYLGTANQLPDPTIETIEGVDTVPAFRDLAYIVFPDRQLTDEQARRHPQWRIEVFTGTGERAVIRPTEIDSPLANYQVDNLLVDWRHDRYYNTDLTDGAEGLRQFRISNNTELAQITTDDLLAGVGLNAAGTFNSFGLFGSAVGQHGLYFAFVYDDESIGHVETIRVNTTTLIAEARHPGNDTVSGFWQNSAVLPLPATDIILSASVVGPRFAVTNGDTLIGVTFWQPVCNVGMVCRGLLDSTGRVHGYAIAVSASSSPSSAPLMIKRVSAWLNPFTGLIEYEFDDVVNIELTDVDAGWQSFINIEMFNMDEADGGLIIGLQGYTTGGGSQIDRLFKWDPETQTILWNQVMGSFGSGNLVYGQHYNDSRINGFMAWLTSGVNVTRELNTLTGEFTDFSWSDAGLAIGTFGGNSVFDGGGMRIITFENIPTSAWVVLKLGAAEPGDVSLATIVRDVSDRCGLNVDDDINVDDLEDKFIHGYARTRPMTGRATIEPLRSIGFFDGVESDDVLKFPTRGKANVATITSTHLGAYEGDGEPPPAVITRKMQDVELPRRLRVHYLAPTRDYEPGEQVSPTRLTTDAVNEVDMDLVAALDDTQAAQIAEIIWDDTWRARWQHSISLDRYWSELEPADCIAVPVDGRAERMRIIFVDDSDNILRRLELLRDDGGSYESEALADPPARPASVLRLIAASELLLLDLPPLREQDNDAGIYAAVVRSGVGTTWNGMVIYRSNDSGGTYSQLASVVNDATVGRVAVALPAGITSTWDNANTLEVVLTRGELENRTEADVLNGANAAAIGAHGRWEIVQFLRATEVSPGRYQLTGLLRGRRGTEHHVGTSQVNDYFVLISGPGIIRLPLQVAQIGQEMVYRPVSIGASFSSAVDQDFTGEGEALEPFTPVRITGERGDSPQDWFISGTRRDRLYQTMQDGVALPNSETISSFELDIYDGTDVVRTLESSTPEFTYTELQQIADFGAPVATVTVAMYQLSATVGRGTPGEAVIS